MFTEEIITTDVLVVGAGASGMMAAISAADGGARVALCEKGNSRRSGGITGGNDHFFCYNPEIHGAKLREHAIKEKMSIGLVNEDLVHKEVDLSYVVLRKWESWGVNMKKNGHYEFTGHGWPGSTGKTGEPGKTNRFWVHFSDDSLCMKLDKQLSKRKINVLNRVMVIELLLDTNGGVVGAIGISTREPKLYLFQAKAVILNKGEVNPTRLYPPPHIIGYSMAHPGTGDGVIMAFRAGADIQNAEQCRRQVSLKFGPFASKGTWIGVLRDSEGSPIAPPYLSKPNAEIGDPSVENADALDRVWAQGKGPVWMDPRQISEEDELYMRWGFESEAMHPFLKWIDHEKIDLRKTRFEFTPIQPSPHIAVHVNANYRSTIKGLYATLPTHLCGAAVAGMVAGESAAKDIKDSEHVDLGKYSKKVLQFKQKCGEILERKGQQFADWREVQWAIWQTMYCYVSPPNRTEHTLEAGYNQLLRLKEQAHRIISAGNQHDLYHCLEVLNLIDVAEIVILAVRERKESRGQARRQDYPFMNPLLNKFLIVRQKNGKPTFVWKEPRRLADKGKRRNR